jgi:hypothetical protein
MERYYYFWNSLFVMSPHCMVPYKVHTFIIIIIIIIIGVIVYFARGQMYALVCIHADDNWASTDSDKYHMGNTSIIINHIIVSYHMDNPMVGYSLSYGT